MSLISIEVLSFNSNELILLTDRSKASGELRVYIKNIGDKDLLVVTGNLLRMSSDSLIEIEPERHVLIEGRKRVELKESLADYSVVKLRSGEVTYLKRITIMEEHGRLSYNVKDSWAKMHGVWGGKLFIDF